MRGCDFFMWWNKFEAHKASGILVSALCVLLCLANFLSLSLSLPVSAETSKKKVRIGWYPYDNIQEGINSENLNGYNYEFLEKISLYTNWECEYVFVSWDDCIRMLHSGEIDILGYMAKTPDRDNDFLFSTYECGHAALYLVSSNNDNTVYYEDDFSGFDDATVATIPSSFYTQQLQNFAIENGITLNTVEYETQEDCFSAMSRGTVDLVLASSSSYFEGYRVAYHLLDYPFYFAVSMGREDLQRELDDALHNIMTANPNYTTELFEKYCCNPMEKNEICLSKAEAAYIANEKPIKVAVSQDNYPMSYIGTDNKHHGFIYEYLNLLSEKSGLQFSILYYDNYFQTIRAVGHGDADIILQLTDDFKFSKSNHMTLTQPYLSIQRGFLVKDAKEIKTVALENGQRTISMPNVKFIRRDSITQCIDSVEEDLADAAIVNIYAYQRAAKLYPHSSFSFQVIQDERMDYAIGVSEYSDPMLCNLLDKIIGSIDKNTVQFMLSSSAIVPQKTTVFQWIKSNRYFVLFLLAIIIGGVLFLLVFFEQRLTGMEKKNNQILAEKNRELEKANAAKSDFLSRTSHDLRSPMNAIMGLTALALDEPSVVQKDFYLSQISTSSQFLLGLINDVLDMNRIEEGAISLNPEPYSFQEFCQMLKTIIGPLCFQKNIDFVFEDSDFKEVLLVDRTRFNQIFFNLLSNAVKYTPENGTITFDVSYRKTGDKHVSLDFLVADTGIGMSTEFMEHMFEPFSQENRMGDVKGQSSGLGLAIVKSMIDLMNGTIHVESTLHQGSIFHVHLDVPLTDAENDSQKFIDPIELDKVLRYKRILLVDDQPLNLEVAQKILEKKGMEVTIAMDGQQSIDIFNESEENYFDAILMDIRMPNMNGLQASSAIRALPREDASTIPIIAMTANTFDEDKEQSKAAGMNAHLGKPIIPKELFECLYLHFQK